MAIRFCCPSCRKPLEVDTQLAGKDVLCFFCHDKVAVPTESDPSLGTPGPDGQTQTPPPPPGNSPVVGYIGLIASLGMIAIFLFILSWGYGQMLTLARDSKFTSLPQVKQKEVIQQKTNELLKKPMRIYGIYLLVLLGLLGIGFSIGGVAKNRGMIPAVFGLIICGGFIIFMVYVVWTVRASAPR